MEIITADLVNVMNQPEGQTPEFDALWDATLAKFEEHQASFIEICPAPVKKFIKNLNLFNCTVHSRSSNFINDEYPIIIGKPSDRVYSLSYEVIEQPRTIFHSGSGFDSSEKALWLYDEFHKVENHFVHNILFSDGLELQIPFVFFFYREQSWFEEQV